jgi:hypothetical protein
VLRTPAPLIGALGGKIRAMQSDQETVLEEFMQRSFGAQSLYVPKKYDKGSAQREPADLAWCSDGLVVLFYMRSSKEELPDQIDHNMRQAVGYHRLWASGRPKYALRGRNRFGDECFVPYNSVRAYLTLLVVSDKCGVDILEPIARDIQNAVVVVPETLLHWIAEFGGSIVDLLTIIDSFLAVRLEVRERCEDNFEALNNLVVQYVNESLVKADPSGRYLSGAPQHDYLVLGKYLSHMKVPAEFGKAVSTAKGREEISRVFGDLMLVEYASFAATAEAAIQASEPPLFKKWAIRKVRGLYYPFVVATLHMGSSNVLEVTNAAIEACKNESGEVDCICAFYGNVLNANEYRSPLMLTLPPKLPEKHAMILTENIVKRLTVRSPAEERGVAT